MKMTHKFTAALLGVVAMVSATMTHAQLPPRPHFVFTVPVRLVNLPPEINYYAVFCNVYKASDVMTAMSSTGTDTIMRPISGGAVNAEIVVNASIRTARDPLDHPAIATNYKCFVVLWGPDRPFMRYDHTADFPLSFGAPFIPVVSGPIPP